MNKLKLFFFTLIGAILGYLIADEVESRLNTYITENIDNVKTMNRLLNLSNAIFWVVLCIVVFITLYVFARFKHDKGFFGNFITVWSAATLAIFLTILVIKPLIDGHDVSLKKDEIIDTLFETLKYSIAPSFAALYGIERHRF